MNELLQQSSPLVGELCRLPVPAEPSRGGSHLTQLSRGIWMGSRGVNASLLQKTEPPVSLSWLFFCTGETSLIIKNENRVFLDY